MKRLLLLVIAACDPAPVTIDQMKCPPGGTMLTYDNFGAQFMNDNCNSCPSAQYAARHGAPDNFRFDTLDEVRSHAARIFVDAAGPTPSIPPGPYDPPPDERERLAEWLVCGAP